MALRIWARRLARTQDADAVALRRILKRVRPLKALLNATDRTATRRLSSTLSSVEEIPKPSRTSWTWRPDLGPVSDNGPAEPVGSNMAVSREVRLFHDADLAEIGVLRNGGTGGKPGISAEIYGFDGTYLSFAVTLPTEAMAGLRLSDLFRVELDLVVERQIDVSVRLNLCHGPNVERIVRRLDISKGERMVEFDISYTAFNPERSRDIWFDIIFDRPEMNRIDLHDMQILRRGRADI